MTLDKQVTAKLAFEPGDKKKLEEIWLTVEKTIDAWSNGHPGFDLGAIKRRAKTAFHEAYLARGIKGPLAARALDAVGL